VRVAVLGAGRVGAAIARDLATSFQVLACDASAAPLESLSADGIATRQADLVRGGDLEEICGGVDIVVAAVPGHLGFSVAERVLRCSRPLVDISFFPEEPFALDRIARDHGVVAAVDCGVAPGTSHVLAGYASTLFERFDRYRCLVGGLPWIRHKPFEYSAPFSPADVIEEYVRPARSIRGGKVVTVAALSEVELVDLPGVGALEAFATDGLRSLLHLPMAPEMEEKTLRWPGHADLMRVFRDLGLFDEMPLELPSGIRVAPRELVAKLLFAAWTPQPGAPELTVMRVEAEGLLDGQKTRVTWDLLDQPSPELGTSSMARTTGYTCTAVVDLVARGILQGEGLVLPEHIGLLPGGWASIAAYLAARGITVTETRQPV
jgi:saccharopine dehydrogenase-like NADP-dependent oxidoreductase